jgi:hypothetical protein
VSAAVVVALVTGGVFALALARSRPAPVEIEEEP